MASSLELQARTSRTEASSDFGWTQLDCHSLAKRTFDFYRISFCRILSVIVDHYISILVGQLAELTKITLKRSVVSELHCGSTSE